ncbi:MAG: hypothetical protein AB7O49_04665 [Sphingomonadales bacterium]
MKSILHAALLFAAMGAASAVRAETIDFTGNPDAAAGKIAEKAYGSEITDARAAGSSATIWAGRLDLDGDGKPEIVGQLSSAYICGGMGPCFFVVSPEGKLLFSVPGVDGAEALASRTNGWRDLRFNGQAVWKFNGKEYDIAK